MIDALTAAATLYALVLALAAALGTVQRQRSRSLDVALYGLGVVVALRAAIDVISLLSGHRSGEPGVHLAYLATSVVVVPVTAVAVKSDRGRWATLLCSGAALLLAVLLIRLQTTWRTHHG